MKESQLTSLARHHNGAAGSTQPFMFIREKKKDSHFHWIAVIKKTPPVQKEHRLSLQTDVCIILSIKTALHLSHPIKKMYQNGFDILLKTVSQKSSRCFGLKPHRNGNNTFPLFYSSF